MTSPLSNNLPPNLFAVATYNVWFGTDVAGAPYPEARMKALVEALLEHHSEESSPPVAIGLQEVIPSTTAMLVSELNKHGYTYFLLTQPTQSYGCALAILVQQQSTHNNVPELVDHGWKSYGVNTSMNRGFLWAHLKWPDTLQEILVTTTHLESPIDAGGTTNRPERIIQFRNVVSFCEEEMKRKEKLMAAIITGDFNWCEQVSGTGNLLSTLNDAEAWTDAWLETHQNDQDPGYTFDSFHNSFINGDRQSRLDRVLVRSKCIVPIESFLVGREPIAGISITKDDAWTTPTSSFSTPTRTTRQCPVLPSDHFGVVVRMQREGVHEQGAKASDDKLDARHAVKSD